MPQNDVPENPQRCYSPVTENRHLHRQKKPYRMWRKSNNGEPHGLTRH